MAGYIVLSLIIAISLLLVFAQKKGLKVSNNLVDLFCSLAVMAVVACLLNLLGLSLLLVIIVPLAFTLAKTSGQKVSWVTVGTTWCLTLYIFFLLPMIPRAYP